MIRTSKRKRRTSSVCTWSRRSMRPCSASTKRPRSGAESESAVPLHADLFLLVEPGGAVVCQNPARCHYPGRLHLGRRSSAETAEIHSRLRPGRETIPLDLYRSAAANPYLRNHRDSVLDAGLAFKTRQYNVSVCCNSRLSEAPYPGQQLFGMC